MMELSENVSYMKLLHELKGDFPNMADDFIHQCIKQHGIDKTACAGALRLLEAQQLSGMTMHNHSYAPARTTNLRGSGTDQQNNHSNFPRKMSALISHQLDQRQKLEQRLEAGNSELQTLTRNAHGLKVLLEARTKFIQTGVVDVEVTNELEQDVSQLQHHCDDMASRLDTMTQETASLGDTSSDFNNSIPAVLRSLSSIQPDPGNVSGDRQKSKSTPVTPSKPIGLGTFLTSGGNGNHTRVPTGNNYPGNRPATALPSSTSTASVLNNSNLHWACTKCTYDNHPALKECEQCEMPRFS